MVHRYRGVCLWVAGLLLGASPAAAQVVRGAVVDSGSERPVPGVRVSVLDARGVTVGDTVTGTTGAFVFTLPMAGAYRLRARRIGYAARMTEPLVVTAEFDSYVRLWLAPSAVALDTLTVVAESVVAENQVPFLVQVGFYDRQRQHIGQFLTHDDIERKHAVVASDLLRTMSGVTVMCSSYASSMTCDLETPGSSSMFIGENKHCHVALVLDGVVVRAGGSADTQGGIPRVSLDDVFYPFNLEAVEVYTSSVGLPAQYGGYMSPCGAILAWSRR